MTRFRCRSAILLTSAWLLTAAVHPRLAEYNAINAEARAARLRGDDAAVHANLAKLAAFTPGHPFVQVALARAAAMNGDRAGALAQLDRIADLGFSFDASGDAGFRTLQGDPAFALVARRLADNGKGRGRATAVIKLGLTSGSEGVAWSTRTRSFMMGSAGSIHSYALGDAAARPVARAFAAQILGIRPDPARNSYLVCVNEPGGNNSAVVRHHEPSGGIVAIHRLPAANALCNDIAVLKDGSFAVTDSNNGAFRLVRGKLEPLPLTLPIYQPNGIASDPATNRLFIAHAGGIIVHDLATERSRELAVSGTLVGGLDGIVWHEGALIAVQNLANAAVASRLLRITPDAKAEAARVEVLLAGDDFPGSASTVAVADGDAFMIGRTTVDGRVDPFLIRVPL